MTVSLSDAVHDLLIEFYYEINIHYRNLYVFDKSLELEDYKNFQNKKSFISENRSTSLLLSNSLHEKSLWIRGGIIVIPVIHYST